jgi:hypothetical protein
VGSTGGEQVSTWGDLVRLKELTMGIAAGASCRNYQNEPICSFKQGVEEVIVDGALQWYRRMSIESMVDGCRQACGSVGKSERATVPRP